MAAEQGLLGHAPPPGQPPRLAQPLGTMKRKEGRMLLRKRDISVKASGLLFSSYGPHLLSPYCKGRGQNGRIERGPISSGRGRWQAGRPP